MDRDGFLNGFREALEGKVPDSVIQDNVNYYSEYISSQVRGGKSEAQALSELGDPRLLARTIEESTRFAQGETGSYDSAGEYESGRDEQSEHGIHARMRVYLHKLPTWLTAIVLVIVFALVLVAVFSLLSYFAPVILFFMFVLMIGSAIRTWRDGY